MVEEEVLPAEEDPREIVHWFDRPPVAASSAELSGLLALAFAAGAAAAIGLLAVTGRLRH
jgi:hypothetical protein